MRMDRFGFGARTGFTLIELLMVISVIVLASGVIGFSVLRSDEGMALQSGQRTLIATFNSARSKAILNNTRTRVLICNIPEDSRYLSFLGILEENPDAAGEWRAVDSGVHLPKGVFIIPDSGGRTASSMVSGSDWNEVRSLYGSRVLDLGNSFPSFEFDSDVVTALDNDRDWIFYEYTPTGRPSYQENNRFLITTGSRIGGAIVRLSNPGSAIGIKVRRYGNITALSEQAELVADPVDEGEIVDGGSDGE